MISLDQVLLLEQKVESAVEKIQQLEAENDALRNKCSELTNALSARTEQLKAYESDQQKIESGIIKAIDRLNSIENSVLKAAGQTAAPKQAAPKQEAPKPAAAEPAEEAPAPQEEAPEPKQAAPEPESIAELKAQNLDNPEMNFDSMEDVEAEPDFIEEPVDDSEEEGKAGSTDELGFDIF